MTDLNTVTIAIKTFERYESLCYLLSSIEQLNLSCQILIADDSENSYKSSIISRYGKLLAGYFVLPFDSGLSRGRNVLLQNTQTEHFLLCDDDFVFDSRANLSTMVEYLVHSDIDLLGGMVYNRSLLIENSNREFTKALVRLKARTLWHMLLWRLYQHERLRNLMLSFQRETLWDFFGYFKIQDGTCYISKLLDTDYSPPFTLCDFVPNFFMAKTQVLKDRKVYWDEEIKYIGEHLDFFFRAKRNFVNVAITKDVGVIHQRIHTPYYRRNVNDGGVMMRKNNLSRIQTG